VCDPLLAKNARYLAPAKSVTNREYPTPSHSLQRMAVSSCWLPEPAQPRQGDESTLPVPKHRSQSVSSITYRRPTPSHLGQLVIHWAQTFTERSCCFNKRMARLTYCFSKRWANHRSALALFFAHYNFCRVHKTLRHATPAMAHGLANSVWSVKELIQRVCDGTHK